MAYIDIDYLIAGVIKDQDLADLGDHTNSPGQIGAADTIANITATIARADDTIDSYLRVVYDSTLPLTTVPEAIKDASATLAMAMLWRAKNRVNDVWEDRRTEVLAWLEKVAAGEVVLSLEDDTRVTSRRTTRGTSESDRKFTDAIWGKKF